jgi:hypothetical protein
LAAIDYECLGQLEEVEELAGLNLQKYRQIVIALDGKIYLINA